MKLFNKKMKNDGLAMEINEQTLPLIAAMNGGLEGLSELDYSSYYTYDFETGVRCVVTEAEFNLTHRFVLVPREGLWTEFVYTDR